MKIVKVFKSTSLKTFQSIFMHFKIVLCECNTITPKKLLNTKILNETSHKCVLISKEISIKR